MKTSLLTLKSAIKAAAGGAALLAPSVFAQTDFHANSSEGNANDRWNDANTKRKWTADGKTWAAASAGNTYHTNGYQIKAGQIGQAKKGKPGMYVFAGDKLIVDGFSPASKLKGDKAGGGEIHFELSAAKAIGPRTAGLDGATKGGYRANIVTAPTTGTEVRTLRGSVGAIILDGTLTLEGATRFTTGTLNDMTFVIRSTVTGRGSIDLSGGSSGGKIANSWLTWAFRDLNGWQGRSITVSNKHTLSFTGPADFATTNPGAAISFSNTSPGFINLSADVSVAAGNFSYGPHVLSPGVYTADDLNALHAAQWGGNKAYPFASGNGRLFVGQPIAK